MTNIPKLPSSEEFTHVLGQVTWLMTLSKPHRERLIAHIDDLVVAPLMLKQVRVYLKGKQPLAAVMWAYASSEVKAKIGCPPFIMGLNDWRSGPDIVVVDCISPFADPNIFIEQFKAQTDRAILGGVFKE